jgi:hypothetical protein
MHCDSLKLFYFNYFHNDQCRGKHMVSGLSLLLVKKNFILCVFNFYS